MNQSRMKFEEFALAQQQQQQHGGSNGCFFSDMSMLSLPPSSPHYTDGLSLGLCDVGGDSVGVGIGGVGGKEVGGVSIRHGKDEEYESRSVIENIEGSSGSGDDDQKNELHRHHDPPALSDAARPGGPSAKKRYHRHQPTQIQELEGFFKECPHPDDKMRQLLSKKLNLTPRQVKFWFQNRRTQYKAQEERMHNGLLRQENERLRAENIAMREAIRSASCPACGGPATIDMSGGDHELWIENAQLRDELERIYTANGKPYAAMRSLPSAAMLPFSIPPLGNVADLTVGTNITTHNPHHNQNQNQNHNHQQGHGISNIGFHNEMEKALLVDEAMAAMDEFLQLNQAGDSMWVPSPDNPMVQVLDHSEYTCRFPKTSMCRPPNFHSEATRTCAEVMMNGLGLVNAFLDVNRWMEMFPCVVNRAEAGEVISTGLSVTRNGALQMMYAEMQVLSPLVPTREIYFLRFCKLLQDNAWAIVDVSVDPQEQVVGANSMFLNKCRRRPSGCLIQELPNGYSKVSWIEHWEYDEQLFHPLYRSTITSGMAFGALRWLATMKRQCEHIVSLMASNLTGIDSGAIPTLEGRRSMLKLAQRMTVSFCNSVNASPLHSWTALSGGKDGDEVRIMTRKSSESIGDSNGIVLCAATSISLPVSPRRLFEFLRNENLRKEWDALSMGVPMHEVIHIAKGEDPGNCVSLLQAHNSMPNNMLILQECCTDASGSLVVYAPVDVPNISAVMNGGEPSLVTILPSGFSIMPSSGGGLDCIGSSTPLSPNIDDNGSNAERASLGVGVGGSLLTVAFQILVNSMPGTKFTLESINTVNSLVTNTVKQIRQALR